MLGKHHCSRQACLGSAHLGGGTGGDVAPHDIPAQQAHSRHSRQHERSAWQHANCCALPGGMASSQPLRKQMFARRPAISACAAHRSGFLKGLCTPLLGVERMDATNGSISNSCVSGTCGQHVVAAGNICSNGAVVPAAIAPLEPLSGQRGKATAYDMLQVHPFTAEILQCRSNPMQPADRKPGLPGCQRKTSRAPAARNRQQQSPFQQHARAGRVRR